MKPLIVSSTDSGGGAARAAYRLHRALIEGGWESTMRVARKRTDDWRVVGPSGYLADGWTWVRAVAGHLPARLQATTNPILHSTAAVPSRLSATLNRSDSDVVNLHWINWDMISVEDLPRIRKPVVWTLHDSWAFCGAEHHPNGMSDDRFARGYTQQTRPPCHRGFDVDAWVWRRKRRAWRKPMAVVAPSTWLAECARRSIVMRDWPIRVVPNPLPIDVYQPWPKPLVRRLFGISTDAPTILFGALGGMADPIKGWDLLSAALAKLPGRLANCHAVVFGQSEPKNPPRLGMPVRYVGRLQDDAALSMLYSAADVMVIPSRMENLPQTGTEAHACGTPVVAFRVGGIPDVVSHRSSGYLAEPYDADDLAEGIAWVLGDAERHARLSEAARARAVERWAPGIVARQYMSVYEAAVAAQHELVCKAVAVPT